MAEKIERKLIVKCGCDGEILSFEIVDWGYLGDDDKDLYINFYLNLFHSKQISFLDSVRSKFKLIWSIIRGKEYSFFDVVISGKTNINQFKEDMLKFLEDS